MKNQLRIAGTVCFSLALVILLATLALTYQDWEDTNRTRAQIRQTRRILERSTALLSLMKDAETGLRGYLLTGDSVELAALERAAATSSTQLDWLQAAAAGLPEQQTDVQRLRPAVGRELASLNAAVALRKREGPEAAIAAFRGDRGETTTAEIRAIGLQMGRALTARLTSMMQVSEARRRRVRTLTAVGSGVLFTLLLAAGFAIGRANARSRASERRMGEIRDLLQTTLTSIADGVIATDAAGTITFLNPAARRLTGWAEAEALGQPIDNVFRLVNETTGEPIQCVASQMLRDAAASPAAAALLQSRDGRTFPVDENASPIPSPIGGAGSNAGMTLVFRDLTSRKKAKQAMLDLASIVKHSEDAIIGMNLEGDITGWNDAAHAIFGYSAEEMIGRSIATLTPAGAFDDMDETLGRIRRNERIRHYETVRRRKDGVTIAVAVSISPILDGSGRVVGASKIARDISERNRAQEALRDSEGRFRKLFESNVVGLAFCDRQRRVTEANDAYLSIIGYRREEFVPGAIGCGDLTPREYQGLDDRALGGAAAHSVSRLYEKEYVRRDGIRVPIAIGIADLKNSRGEYLAFVLDNSERQQMAEQLLRSQKHESLSVLAGGIAHDFNNLLMSIMANATLMMDEAPAGSRLEDLIERIFAATDQAAQLTRQMLAYSGKGRFAIVPLNLSRLVEDMASLLRATVPAAVELRWNLAPDLPLVEADSSQMSQLVANLALNGSEAIVSKGVVTISARFQEVDTPDAGQNLAGAPLPPGSYAVLEVQDTGTGMDEATLAKIFDPFFTTKFTGRGLGLAAVLGIVRAHRGGISITSVPGQGTTFQVFLPVQRVAVPAMDPAGFALPARV